VALDADLQIHAVHSAMYATHTLTTDN